MTTTTDNCGCPEFASSRRGFLKGFGAVAAGAVVTSTTGGLFRQVAYGDAAGPRNVLVVLSLRGGADGLSMVVPHGDPAYQTARPHIAIPTARLIGSDGMFGLHPSFAPLQSMWGAGKIAAVHAVGLPQPNRSHFAAMEELEDADPGSSQRTGWLNRLIGLDVDTSATQAFNVGSAMVPTALYGQEQVVALTTLRGIGLPGGAGVQGTWKRNALNQMWVGAPGPLGIAGEAALSSVDTVGTIGGRPIGTGAHYPVGTLGTAMADSARIIKAEIGAEIVTLDYGNWDMHVNLGTLANGTMAPMVDELSKVLAAFFIDLGDLADSVTVVTVSEFGRRVRENGDLGVDHGFGNVMMLMGGGVNGGYFSQWPGLNASALVDGDLAVTRDYRSVLAEVVRSRFNADVSQVFPGFVPEAALNCMAPFA